MQLFLWLDWFPFSESVFWFHFLKMQKTCFLMVNETGFLICLGEYHIFNRTSKMCFHIFYHRFDKVGVHVFRTSFLKIFGKMGSEIFDLI